MSRDPFEFVTDAPLFVVPRMLEQLRAYRDGPKLADMPGANPSPQRERLAVALDDLANRLLAGVAAHPTRFWVLKQMQQTLLALKQEDAGAREHLGGELERLLGILGIDDTAGMLTYYLG